MTDVNFHKEFDIIFLATELYFKAKQLVFKDIASPYHWIISPKEHVQAWESKKKELIASDNYDANNPMVQYCEIMCKYVKQHNFKD